MKELRLANGNIEFRYLDNLVGLYKPKDKLFIKYRKESDIFRKFNGLAISFDILNRLRVLGCNKIVILLQMNNDTIQKYETTVEQYLNEGLIYVEGGDAQRILTFDILNKKNLKGWF